MKLKLKHLLLGTLVPATLCMSADAAYVTIYDTLHGGSGDVDNVLYQSGQTGTSIDAYLNTSGKEYAANFTSTTSLHESGGQAHLTTELADSSFTDLSFSLLDGYSFTKLQLNPDGVAGSNGLITFTVDYIMPAGVFNSVSYTLNANGQNFFTVEAGDGAYISKVSWVSTIGVSDANQYRVGGLYKPDVVIDPRGVPDGGTTLASLGIALLGLGSMRKLIGSKTKA